MLESSALPFDRIPQPPRPALGGHLREWLGVRNAQSVLTRLLRYAHECGPIARVSLGPVRLLLLSDPDVVADALSDERANVKGAAYVLTRAVLDNVLLLNGAAWESHRKTYRSALRGVDVMGAASRVSSRYVAELREHASAHPSQPLMLDELVSRWVGDVVGDFVAGVRLTPEFERHRRVVQYELAAIGIDLQCQPWTYLSPARWVRLRRAVRGARAFFREAVEARLAGRDADAPDILGGFIELARAGHYPLDANAIQEGVVNFFFTAHDVLASSTSWTLELLARHPEEQARLRAALPGALREREALEGCSALTRVAREGLRLYPGYGLFGRTTRAPMVLGGYHVPRGTMLIASPFVMHRLDRHFPDAAEFRPERWLGAARGAPPPNVRDAYMPFGSGARGCLASHLAFPLLCSIVAHAIESHELESAPGPAPELFYWGTSYAREGMPVLVRSAARSEHAHAAP